MAFEVRSEQSGDFLRLARLWQRGKTHSWIFVALDVAQERDALIQRLNALAAGGCVSVQPGQTARDLEHALTQSHQFERLHVVLEPGCIWDAPWWQDANTLRERLADAWVHRSLIFAKLPSLFLNPRLARRTDWQDELDDPRDLDRLVAV